MTSSTNDLHPLVIKEFTEHFGCAPSYVSRAPGRVNIIGEHTDYNDGFVFPAAINRATYIAGKLRDDDLISVKSLDYHDAVTFSLDRLREESLPKYTRYVRGVPWILREEGYQLRGMNLAIVSDVPGGGGFSSSAAVEVAMFELASALLDIKLDQRQKAVSVLKELARILNENGDRNARDEVYRRILTMQPGDPDAEAALGATGN